MTPELPRLSRPAKADRHLFNATIAMACVIAFPGDFYSLTIVRTNEWSPIALAAWRTSQE